MDERDRVRYRSRRLQQKLGREPRAEERVHLTEEQPDEGEKQPEEGACPDGKQLLMEETSPDKKHLQAEEPFLSKKQPQVEELCPDKKHLPEEEPCPEKKQSQAEKPCPDKKHLQMEEPCPDKKQIQTEERHPDQKQQLEEEPCPDKKQPPAEELFPSERRAAARGPASKKRRLKDRKCSYSGESIQNWSGCRFARRNPKRKKQAISTLLYLAAGILASIICTAVLVPFFMPKDSPHESAVMMRKFEFPRIKASESKGVIMLDAGHGGRDQGASYKDVLEKDLNLEIAEKAKPLLEDAGYQVLLTRSKDKLINKYERADYANSRNPDVLVSIHCNFLKSGRADGIETYYDPARQEGSQPLADKIQAHIIEETGATDRGSRAGDFVLITDTTMPAALVEVGFLSDKAERALLQDEAYQKKLADGIVSGIIEYMEAQSGDEQEAE